MHAPFTLVHSTAFEQRCCEVFGSLERADSILASLLYELAVSAGETEPSYIGRMLLAGAKFNVEIELRLISEGVILLGAIHFHLRRAA